MSLFDLKKWNWGTRLAYARNLILLCLIYNFGGRKYLFGADGGMHQYLWRSVKPGGRLSFSLKLVAVIASRTIMERGLRQKVEWGHYGPRVISHSKKVKWVGWGGAHSRD